MISNEIINPTISFDSFLTKLREYTPKWHYHKKYKIDSHVCAGYDDILSGFSEWNVNLKEKADEETVAQIDWLFNAAKTEVARIMTRVFRNDFSDNLSDEDYLLIIDMLGGMSSEHCIGICGPEGACTEWIAYLHREITNSECFACTLLASYMDPIHPYYPGIALYVKADYVQLFNWIALSGILKYGNLRHVGVIIDDYSFKKIDVEDSILCGYFWDIIEDKCYGVYQKSNGCRTEIEDGYPLNINLYSEVYIETEMTPEFEAQKSQWYSMQIQNDKDSYQELMSKIEKHILNI